MPRAAAATIALITTGLILAGALAAPRPQQACTAGSCSYLPVVQVPQPSPTPSPTPPLPSLATLVLQPDDLTSFTRDTSREITNTEDAQTYLDPAAALITFQQQGRETSWFVRYRSNAPWATAAVYISDQVIRYLTPEGADAGMTYAVADERASFSGYKTVTVPQLGDRAEGYVRTYVDQGRSWRTYYVAIRKGRSVALVQLVGEPSALDYDGAMVYVQKAADRLP
jgi:hypothetical protein